MVKLGRLELKTPYVVAPMSIMSDIGFRTICSEYGASHSFTEQLHAKEFVAKTEKMKRKLDLFEPCGIQFLTNSPDELKKAIMIIKNEEYYPNLDKITSIDLNMGCPAGKIRKQKLGSELMKENDLVIELFNVMKKFSDIPVSAKIRLGVNAAHKRKKPYLRIAKIAQNAGLDFITIHGRMSSQLYEGEVDTEAIKEVCDNVEIPVIGNGNIVDKKSADEMLQYCKAVMIGRKAVEEPFVFGAVQGKQYNRIEEKIKCIRKYISYVEKYDIGFQQIKVHIQSLLKDTEYFKQMMGMTHCKNIDDVSYLLENVLRDN